MGGRPPVLATVTQMARLPFGADQRRAMPRPTDPVDYEPPELDGSGLPVSSVAVGKTPEGGYREFPPAVLGDSREPLPPGAPDLRGVWECHKGAMSGHVERIEQAGDRVCITAGGVVHDMRVTGRKEDGVNDVAGPTGAPISVAADFTEGRLDLRPGGGKRVLVTRHLDGDELVWRYGPFRNRLRRLSAPAEEPRGEPMAAMTPVPPSGLRPRR